VKPDDNRPDDAADADAWLEGLAGRGGSSEAARDGARLRNALHPDADEQTSIAAPPWRQIVQTAREPVAADSTATTAATKSNMHREAANQSSWRRLAVGGLFALVVTLGAGVWTLAPHDERTNGTMRGAPAAAGAQWRTENPRDAAQALAQRLEAAGARVTVTPKNTGLLLDIACEPSACTRVNEQLAAIEAAVDSSGRLALNVLPLN
jgi:hypothetical protein